MNKQVQKTKYQQLLTKARNAFEENRYNQSVSTLKKINKSLLTKTYESTELEGLAYLKLKKHGNALSAFTASLTLALTGLQQKCAHHNLALSYDKLNKMNNAISHLEACIKIDGSINNAKAHLLLCEYYIKAKKFQDADLLAKKLMSWQTYYLIARYQLLISVRAQQNKEKITSEANVFFNEVINILPEKMTPTNEHYIAFAINSLIDVRAEELAINALKKAELYFNDTCWLQKSYAQLSFNKKNYSHTIERLNQCDLTQILEWENISGYYNLKAAALDKMANYKDAYIEYAKSADSVKALYHDISTKDYVDEFKKISLTSIHKSSEQLSIAQYNTPIFMVGFPRSGTTLLDTIIDTQNNVITLSEIGAINSIMLSIDEMQNKAYPKSIMQLTSNDINTLRDKYFVNVRPSAHFLN